MLKIIYRSNKGTEYSIFTKREMNTGYWESPFKKGTLGFDLKESLISGNVCPLIKSEGVSSITVTSNW